ILGAGIAIAHSADARHAELQIREIQMPITLDLYGDVRIPRAGRASTQEGESG
ncbi:MAG: hypothetical protein QOI90_3973, partial [Mycobacterium sp.]|nr:hypothetical protein [Mycobacterium sp.]